VDWWFLYHRHSILDQFIVFLLSVLLFLFFNMAPGALSMRTFSGKASENVEVWVTDAKRALVAAELDSGMLDAPAEDASAAAKAAHATRVKVLDLRAADALVGCFVDAAAAFGRSLPESSMASPEKVFEALEKRFASAVSKLAARQAIASFRRAAGASVNETWSTLEELCHRANPNMDEAEKTMHLLAALGQTGSQVIALHGEPESLDDAITAARAIEAAHTKGGPLGSVAAAATGGTVGVAAVQAGPRVDGMSELIGLLRQLVSNQAQSLQPAGQKKQQQRQARGANRFVDGTPVCNECGVLGHMRRECPGRTSGTGGGGAGSAAGPGASSSGAPPFRQ